MANNFENKLNTINKFITLNKKDRCYYTEDYNAVRDHIIEKLVETDPIFKKIYNGSRLCGSYADGLKISKPNEFDVNLILKIRNYKLADITPDTKPGYVKINIGNILKQIKGQVHNREIYIFLLDNIDNNKYLIENKICSWFDSIMSKMFGKYGKCFTKNNKIYKLNYRKSGPAHTIIVEQGERKIDIDFVPAFIFDKSQWIAERPYPEGSISHSDWTAIPKPIKGRHSDNIGFRSSYVDTERTFMENKYNMKNTLKLIKKLRDHNKITNLRSYYIKTVFLWENDIQPQDFWNQAAGLILIHMCEIVVNVLEKRYLPFFWDKSENMLAVLKDSQINSMYQQFKSLTNKLKKYKEMNSVPDTIYNLFLDDDEISSLTFCDIENKTGVKVLTRSLG